MTSIKKINPTDILKKTDEILNLSDGNVEKTLLAFHNLK